MPFFAVIAGSRQARTLPVDSNASASTMFSAAM